MIAPKGITPPPSALAQAIRSGFTSSWFTPNQAPVRPIPVCTSSAIKSAPLASQIAFTSFIYPAGGTIIPPSPWMGSKITAAVSSLTLASIALTSP